MPTSLSPQIRMAVAQVLALAVAGMLAKQIGPQMRRNVIVGSIGMALLCNVVRPKLAAELYERGL